MAKKNRFGSTSKTEESSGRDLNFSDELQSIHQFRYQTGPPGWRNTRLTVVFQNQQTGTLTYTALEDKLKTQKIIIEFRENAVETIQIQNHLNTAIAKNQAGTALRSHQRISDPKLPGYSSFFRAEFGSGSQFFYNVLLCFIVLQLCVSTLRTPRTISTARTKKKRGSATTALPQP